jgi:probable HAF family extracellular repeat protein
LVTIDAPGAKETIASAINVHGAIVGRYTDREDRVHGFLRDTNGGFHTLDVPGATFTIARGVNDRGEIVGRYEGKDGVGHGFVFSNGNYRTIDYPGPAATETFPWSINSSGAVVGRFTLPGRDGPHGFLLVDGKWSRIDHPTSKTSAANGINSSGDIVGIYFDSERNEHSFRLKNGVFSSIDVPGSRRTLVDAVLDSGTVSGTHTDGQGVHRGYVMDARGCVTTVDQERYPGLTVVRGLNAVGDLVGRYADAADVGRGYLIRGYPIDRCQP